ncbi:MAG: polymerase delta subunit [Solirubrobacterales bacterium]|nr:polymerase delta subunit [Solirubrobacterales bacterium]
MPAFKPAYLIHGDDHGRIAERRARLRAVAEAESGIGGIELFEGEGASADAVAAALSAMTLAIGRRFLIVDGVERWKAADVTTVVAALAELPADTTVAFFAREEGRTKVPAALVQAVEKAGGDVRAELTVKPWELPKWVVARAAEQGIEIHPAAAKALVQLVGDRQQRLLREAEKLALELGPDVRIELEHVEAMAALSAERKVWTLADALLAGDGAAAARVYLQLREQGERVGGLLYAMVSRLRIGLEVAMRLEAGETPSDVRRTLRMPTRAAEAFLRDVQRTDAARLRAAIELFADLELASRGGGHRPLGEDTLALDAIVRIAA